MTVKEKSEYLTALAAVAKVYENRHGEMAALNEIERVIKIDATSNQFK